MDPSVPFSTGPLSSARWGGLDGLPTMSEWLSLYHQLLTENVCVDPFNRLRTFSKSLLKTMVCHVCHCGNRRDSLVVVILSGGLGAESLQNGRPQQKRLRYRKMYSSALVVQRFLM